MCVCVCTKSKRRKLFGLVKLLTIVLKVFYRGGGKKIIINTTEVVYTPNVFYKEKIVPLVLLLVSPIRIAVQSEISSIYSGVIVMRTVYRRMFPYCRAVFFFFERGFILANKNLLGKKKKEKEIKH